MQSLITLLLSKVCRLATYVSWNSIYLIKLEQNESHFQVKANDLQCTYVLNFLRLSLT